MLLRLHIVNMDSDVPKREMAEVSNSFLFYLFFCPLPLFLQELLANDDKLS